MKKILAKPPVKVSKLFESFFKYAYTVTSKLFYNLKRSIYKFSKIQSFRQLKSLVRPLSFRQNFIETKLLLGLYLVITA